MKHLLGKTIGYKCPYCELGDQVIRQNQTTYHYFIGCSDWPKCAFTAELPESLRLKLLGAPMLFPLDKEEIAVQIRRMTPNESVGAISAFGELRGCDWSECENRAKYVFLQRTYLCEAHKLEVEQMMKEEDGPAAL